MYKYTNLWSHPKKRKISWFISFQVLGKKFSCNQGKWGLYYCYFKPVSAIRVTEILNAFRGFVPKLYSGARAPRPLAAKLATYLQFVAHPQKLTGKLNLLIKKR